MAHHLALPSRRTTVSEVLVCNSPLFGTGDVYHCSELDCPVHGERNVSMLEPAKAPWTLTENVRRRPRDHAKVNGLTVEESKRLLDELDGK